jgi:hypothetical protein
MPKTRQHTIKIDEPDLMIFDYLMHIKNLPVYGNCIADLMASFMKLSGMIEKLHCRIDELERTTQTVPRFNFDSSPTILH